jgi:hypothetical protein
MSQLDMPGVTEFFKGIEQGRDAAFEIACLIVFSQKGESLAVGHLQALSTNFKTNFK